MTKKQLNNEFEFIVNKKLKEHSASMKKQKKKNEETINQNLHFSKSHQDNKNYRNQEILLRENLVFQFQKRGPLGRKPKFDNSRLFKPKASKRYIAPLKKRRRSQWKLKSSSTVMNISTCKAIHKAHLEQSDFFKFNIKKSNFQNNRKF